MVQIISGTEVTRPAVTPLTSSILDHATVVENASFGLRNNEGLWPSYNCLDTLVPTALCPNPLGEPKTFSRAEWTPSFEFAVHGGVECSAVGLDRADMEAEVRRVFAASEGRGVEQALLLNRFVEAGSGDGVLWEDPQDLTPAGGVSLLVALALLEGFAAGHYAGLPTIHMPRAAATVLEGSGLIVWNGDKAYTKNGSKVAIGGGYDDIDMLSTGVWDMYATGEVYVERSETVNINSFVIPGDGSGTGSGENGLADNTAIALVERMYRVAVDCFVVKASGSVPAATAGGFGN